jgi:linoleate 10R-lipoxygenase
MPGAGLCPGYTISRAILADAVCLTRGDRFLTVDFTPYNYTSWGYQDCQFGKDDGSYTGMLTKLLFRTLPDYYPGDSAFAFFPFLVPPFAKYSLAKLPESPVDKYNWSRPAEPKDLIVATSYQDVGTVLVDIENFQSGSDEKIKKITNDVLLYKRTVQKLLFSDQSIRTWVHCFQYTSVLLIREKSIKHVGSALKYVDIVKDVINLLPVYWLADEILGLEMKTKNNPRGIYTDQNLYEHFANIGNYVYMNTDPGNDWPLREASHKTAKHFIERIKGHLLRLSGSILSVDGISDSLIGFLAGRNNSDGFLKQLLADRRTHPPEQIAASLFSEVVPTTPIYSKAIAHVVNYYLDENQTEARQDIARLSTLRTPESEARILAYVREALRLDPLVSGVIRTVVADTHLSGGTKVLAGDRVVACVAEANLDKNVFGRDPRTAVYNRTPVEYAGIMGIGPYGLLSTRFFELTVTQVLGVIFNLKDLRRAPGQSGKFNSFVQKSHYGYQERVYIDPQGRLSPYPASLVVQYSV